MLGILFVIKIIVRVRTQEKIALTVGQVRLK